ncbi:MAG: hypothetical protein U0136_21750 [Bdellovibrionota bacterium]
MQNKHNLGAYLLAVFFFATVTTVHATPVTSVSFDGKCDRGIRKSHGSFRQKKVIPDAATCIVKVKVKDSATKKGVAGQAIQVFKNEGASASDSNGCYDPLSAIGITDKKGKVTITFPWDSTACSIVVKNISSGERTQAATAIDLSKVVSCGASTFDVSDVCTRVDYSGYYTITSSDTGFTAGCSGANQRIGILVTKDASAAKGYKVVWNGSVTLTVQTLNNDQLVAESINRASRFAQTIRVTLSSVGTSQAAILYERSDENVLNDPLSAPSCSDTFSGFAHREATEPPDFSGTYTFSSTDPGFTAGCGFSGTKTITVAKAGASYTVNDGSTSLSVSDITQQSLTAQHIDPPRFSQTISFQVAPSSGSTANVVYSVNRSFEGEAACSYGFNGAAAKQ